MFGNRGAGGFGAFGGGGGCGCGCPEPVPVCAPPACPTGGFGAGIIGIAILILIALGVIF
ncbi:MAG: hypothetical protein FWG14_02825 [Peptococcaceae bacterium]|nr:hypothetical protein [Peptococcaceae bacterium]